MQRDGWETVQVHVREKRKWKRYPCAVRANSFIQFKDNKVCVKSLFVNYCGRGLYTCVQNPRLVRVSFDFTHAHAHNTHTHTHTRTRTRTRTHTRTHTHTHTQCINEVARLALTELDVFAGMERSIRTDHKNPMPTRWVLFRESISYIM